MRTLFLGAVFCLVLTPHLGLAASTPAAKDAKPKTDGKGPIDPTGAFAEADKTNQGRLNAEQVMHYFKSKGHQDVDELSAARLVRAVNTEKNGLLDEEQFQNLIKKRNEFANLDKDGDRMVTIDEIKPYFAKFNLSEKDLLNLFANADEDGNSKLDLDEFVFLDVIIEAFRTVDDDNDKIISERELKTFLKQAGAKVSGNDVARLMMAADDDDNGKIEIDEFAKIYLIFDTFCAFDKNHSAHLEKSELEEFFKSIKLTMKDSDLTRLMKIIDEDNNGKIDLDEFAFVYVGAQAFRKYDKDKDNQLSKEELETFFADIRFNISPKNLAEIMEVLDEDLNGKIDFDEFVEMVQVYKYFKKADTDNNYIISAEELMLFLRGLGAKLSRDDVDRLIIAADDDNNGQIDIDEFATIFLVYTNFRIGDKDRDSVITREELGDFLRNSGTNIKEEDLDRLMRIIDEDHNGLVDLDEFAFVFVAQRFFKKYDADKDLQLTKPELQKFFEAIEYRISDKLLTLMVSTLDEDNNGKIDFDEFVEMIHVYKYFKKTDTDSNSIISEPELKKYLTKNGARFGGKDMERLVIAIEEDSNGRIDVHEFAKVFLIFNAFRAADKDHSVHLSKDELYAYLRSVGTIMKEQDIVRLMKQIDEDNNGLIDLDEFAFIYLANRALKKHDKNKDAELSKDELGAWLKAINFTISSDDLGELLCNLDEDNNGKIDFDEFVECYQIIQYFKAYDANHDYKINEAEMEKFLRDAGAKVGGNDIQRLRIAADDDNNGEIDIDEFAKIFLVFTAFRANTKDHGSHMNKKELGSFINSAGTFINERDLDRLMKLIDEDHNGLIDLDEFAFVFLGQLAFKKHDKDKDSKLSKEELTNFFKAAKFDLTETKIAELIVVMDEDFDGKIDFDEFIELFQVFKYFYLIDTNRDKIISRNELETFLRSSNAKLQGNDLDRLTIACDDNNNEKIELDEFAKIFLIFNGFKRADLDHNGHLSADELWTYLKSVGTDIKYGDLIRLMKVSDEDNDGLVDMDEFAFIYLAQRAFKKHDEDSDLQLAKAELTKFFNYVKFDIGEQNLVELIANLDEDNNGKIDFDEFVELFQIYKYFKHFDKDKNSNITEDELKAFLKDAKANVTDQDVKRLMIAADDDSNGQIDIDEFAKIFLILNAFRSADKNRSGHLDREELSDYLKYVGTNIFDDDLTRLMLICDEDGDGQIDLDEFAFIYMAQVAFKRHDKDKDLQLSKEELKVFFEAEKFKITGKDLDELMTALDEDYNGKLDFDEFTQLMQVFKYFKSIDTDHNGVISYAELKVYMDEAGSNLTEDEIKRLMETADDDKDGKIDIDEFAKIYLIHSDFRVADTDKNSIISREELDAYLNKVGAKLTGNDLDRLMIAADDNGDGRIDVEEFAKIYLIYNAFRGADKDRSTNLSRQELSTYLKSAGTALTEDEMSKLMKVVDEDNNGLVDLDEFAFIFLAQQAFKLHDKDKDSHLSKAELDVFFKTLPFDATGLYQTPDKNMPFNEFMEMFQVIKYFKQIDVDANGNVSPNELDKYLNKAGAKLSSNDIERLILAADDNDDGIIVIGDFAKIHLIYNAFRAADKDHNAYLNKSELGDYLKSSGTNLKDSDLTRLMRVMDEDNNGLIDIDEFAFIHVSQAWFKKYDTDNDGQLTKAELTIFFKAVKFEISDENLAEFISNLDEDNNGKIDFDEFVEMVQIYKYFKFYDKNHDYLLEHEELERFLEECGAKLSDNDLERLIVAIDEDLNKKIDVDEFANIFLVYNAFRAFDSDHSYSLTKGEVISFLKAVGIQFTDREVANVISIVDDQQNGLIDLDEFAYIFMSQQAFRKNDADRDGKIKKSELKTFFQTAKFDISDAEIDRVITAIDKDKDKLISFDEFTSFIMLYKLYRTLDSDITGQHALVMLSERVDRGNGQPTQPAAKPRGQGKPAAAAAGQPKEAAKDSKAAPPSQAAQPEAAATHTKEQKKIAFVEFVEAYGRLK